MSDNHSIDTQAREAYKKSVEADKLAMAGRIDEARDFMSKAAQLDLTYVIRAEFIGQADMRKIAVTKTVRRTLIPFLEEAGFHTRDGSSWSEGKFLERQYGIVGNAALIGRDKFGHKLGMLAAREKSGQVDYFDWRSIGLRSGSLAYKTQRELEAACERWKKLITTHLFKWWQEAGL